MRPQLCAILAAVWSAAAVASRSGEDSMLDAATAARSDELPTLKHLSKFISQPDAYVKRVELIDWTFDPTYAEGADRATLTYQTFLLKRHAFSNYFQCSLAALANKWLQEFVGLLSVNTTDDVLSRLHYESSAVADMMPKAMAALRHMRYAAPRWMTMLLLMTEDLAERSRPGAVTQQVFDKVKHYASEHSLRTMAAARAFLDRCDRFLDVAAAGPYTVYEHDVPIKDQSDVGRIINELSEAFDASADALRHDGADAFAVRAGWLLDDGVADADSAFFLHPDDAKWLGIDWKTAVSVQRLRVGDARKLTWGVVRDSRFESFDTGRMLSVQDFVRDAFRLVVLRFLHVGAAHCDHMYQQTNSLLSTQQRFVDLYRLLCAPIATVAEDASRYLGGDQALDGLVPLLRAMVAVPNYDVSTVRARTAALLDRASGYMGVDALGPVQPIFENQLSMVNPQSSTSNMFLWVKRHFEKFEGYVATVRTKNLKLSFEVVDYMQTSFANEWIHYSG